MVNTRIRKTRSEREYEEVIDEYITTGYKVQNRGQKTTSLINAKYGGVVSHILIFIIFGWWTIFVANIIWLAYNYYSNSDKVLVKLIDEPPVQSARPSQSTQPV